ncbi:sugar ABC transporter permease [Spirochaeta africana]|uniref:Maltose/maltodextrin transport system permease protein MalG n=1 Tax=Spirochaeta africana (strain ATCC 700263 / DSM 8902 / Z-7692) TaxID=889378 RepID=H9UI89_SPIAZ|nr:sugar ABC transporter permease [Spirochaeta africana]AFG37232.1 ABC-type maltose transport systems, permease component [Spirochaeta africana DSM 8902]
MQATETQLNKIMKQPRFVQDIQKYGFVRWFFFRARGDAPFKRILIHLALIMFVAIAVYPGLRIVAVSLRPGNRLLTTDLSLIPEGASFDNYRAVFVGQNANFLLWVYNSLIITISTSIIGVSLAATSAYAFSRYRFPGKLPGLIFLLTTQMIPAGMLIIPLYILAVQFGLRDQWLGLVMAYSVGSIPFSIWILKGYYDTIPVELEQSAMIDGATAVQSFTKIILPLSTPALAIAFLFNFTQVWNDFLLARVIIHRDAMYTWTLGLQRMQGQFTTQWGQFSAASLMISIPVIALFVGSSKYMLSGLTLGGVKG